MKNILLKIIAVVVISTVLSLSYLFLPTIFISLDNRLKDFMFNIRGEIPQSGDVVIVDIDEKSIEKYGQWPWSRDIISTLIDKLTQHQAGIIGLDIVFAEEDRSSPHKILERFPEINQTLPNNDKILANSFLNSPVIGGYIFILDKNDNKVLKEAPMLPAIFVEKGLIYNETIIKAKNVIPNIPLLQDTLYSSGFFNNLPDENGMIRKVPLIMKYDNSIYTSLPLEMVRVYSGINRVDIIGDEFGVKDIALGDYKIPIDSFGRLFVNFRGAKKHFKYISVVDIIEDRVDTEDIQNKFILIGTSLLGLHDLRAIAYDSSIAGVEIHANIIDNLLQGDFLSTPINSVIYNNLIIWSIVILLMLSLNYIRSWLVLPFSIVLLYGLSYIFFILLFDYGLVLNILFPLLAFILTLIASIGIDYTIEHKHKEEAKKMLGKKVSNSVMNYLLKHTDEDLVASREVEATIFFSDIVGFTSISEKIGSPDRLIKMLNHYITPMVDDIIINKGTIDKFIGDAIMAYWNAPLKIKNHADMALKSAIAQIEMLEKINSVITIEYDITIDIGIGLHTGLVTAGDMGSKGRSDYTIIGDNVNLASRLEGLTRNYGVHILISSATYKSLKEDYNIRPIDIVEVKGKSKPVEIYQVICNTINITENESNLYSKALSLFRNGEVEEAQTEFKTLLDSYPSKLYQGYYNRCQDFIDHPQKEFTPILKMMTK